MATAIFEKNLLNTPLLIALALLKGIDQAKRGSIVNIYTLTEHLLVLKNEGIGIDRASMAIHAYGQYYCRDLDLFLTEEEMYGNLTHYHLDSVGFTPQTELACLTTIQDYTADDPELEALISCARAILGIEQ